MSNKCELCFKLNSNDSTLLTLPCGFIVCIDHLKKASDLFECFICRNHFVNKIECFSMNKNRCKLQQIDYFERIEDLKINLEDYSRFKNNPDFYIKQSLFQLVTKVNKKRDFLKSEISKKIDSYANKLIDEINNHKSDYLKSFEKTINFNLVQFDEFLNENPNKKIRIEDLDQFYQTKLSILNSKIETLKSKISEIELFLEKIKSIEFKETNSNEDINLQNLFGCLQLSLFESEPDQKQTLAKAQNLDHYKQFKNISVFNQPTNVWYFDELSSGELIAISDESIKIINLKSFETVRVMLEDQTKLELGPKWGLKTNKDEILIASSSGLIKCFDLINAKCLNSINSNIKINCIELSHLNSRLLTGHLDGSIQIWNLGSRISFWAKIDAHQQGINCLKTFDKNRFLSASNDGLKLWNIKGKTKYLKSFTVQNATVIEKLNDIEFITGSKDRAIKIWNIDLEVCSVFREPSGNIISFQVCQENKFLTCSSDGLIRVWDKIAAKWTSKLQRQNHKIKFFKLINSGELVCCFENGNLSIWK